MRGPIIAPTVKKPNLLTDLASFFQTKQKTLNKRESCNGISYELIKAPWTTVLPFSILQLIFVLTFSAHFERAVLDNSSLSCPILVLPPLIGIKSLQAAVQPLTILYLRQEVENLLNSLKCCSKCFDLTISVIETVNQRVCSNGILNFR